jgi:hypothetical protein
MQQLFLRAAQTGEREYKEKKKKKGKKMRRIRPWHLQRAT